MAVYTQTLKEYLEQYDGNVQLNVFIAALQSFPSFVVTEEDGTVISTTSLYDIFIGRFLLREICCESSEQFLRYLNATLDEVNIKYGNEVYFAKKIYQRLNGLQNQNYTESEDIEIDETDGNTNSTYYNPMNSQSDKLQGKIQVDNTIDRNGSITHNRVHVPSYSEFIDDIKKVTYYYNEIVSTFDSCFMSIY